MVTGVRGHWGLGLMGSGHTWHGGIFTGKVARIFQQRIEKSQEILMNNHVFCNILSSFLS